jgi:hypothetical protein
VTAQNPRLSIPSSALSEDFYDPAQTSTEFSMRHTLIQTLMRHLFVSGAYLLMRHGIMVVKSFLELRWEEL